MPKDEPRGLRNFNPGNLMSFGVGIKWRGLASPPKDLDDYYVFTDPVWGIRALAMDLLNDWSQDRKRTVRELITEFAPASHKTKAMPGGNPTETYIRYVAKAMGVPSVQEIDLNDFAVLKSMVTAIIVFENGGNPYTDAQIDRALVLAGGTLPVPARPINDTAVKGAAVVTGAGAAGVGLEAAWQLVEPARQAIIEAAPYVDAAKWILLVLTLIGAGVTIYSMVKRMRSGQLA